MMTEGTAEIGTELFNRPLHPLLAGPSGGRHGGYDIRAAEKDANSVFPIDRLREFVAEGVIGELNQTAYSFVGATSQIALKKIYAPKWALMLKEQAVDAVLLVPV